MKKLLLLSIAFYFSGLLMNVMAQELTLTIVETHKDGETSISFDDGEYENDSIDKLDDDDLDMGWEGEDLNIMTSFTRFQNVTIPQGTTINSAVLTIYAHEDEEDEAIITVYGEAADNSAPFVETEALADRSFTSASVNWTCSDSWTMWQPYQSPDLTSIIQEIVNRPGWVSGNALTLFMKGEDQGASLLDNARDFESYENIEDPDDGGDGLQHPERVPTLVITYGSATGIKAQNANQALKIYPNPATTGIVKVSFENNGKSEVALLDIAGKVIYSETTESADVNMNLTQHKSGLYFVRVTSENASYTQKLIIE